MTIANRDHLPPRASLALRGRHLLLIDAVSIVAAFMLAFALRFDAPSELFRYQIMRFLWLVPVLLSIRLASNFAFHLYQRVWRYASVAEMQAVVLAASTGSVVFGLFIVSLSLLGSDSYAYGFPRSILGIEWLLYLSLLGASRFSLRVIGVSRWARGFAREASHSQETRRVVIVGAGDAGAMVAREIHQRPRLAMEPVGFVDDDPRKRAHWIHGVQVAGSRADLPELVRSLRVDTIIVAMPTAPGTVIREVLQSCKEIGVDVMTVPGIAELVSGRVTVDNIRPVQVEDLLRREPASIDLEAVAGYLRGATVMVTGAGGSIGSELCRQIATFHPARLLLLGRGENSIYHVQLQLQTGPKTAAQLVPLIADIRDTPRLKSIMLEHRPSVVFHAAAHKHVPLMEANPSEAIATNVFGTRNLLDASVETGVESFVLVSTDKAVNPTNVMGATKRIAELLLQETAASSGRRYVAVRFGNVLGSRGSVLPLFKRQITAGGPVTVTHREVTRYFMTIPEAVQLIIQAGAMGRGGETFVLDMGNPIRVYDLAMDLIRLSGFEPYRDINIEVTGLRPGEKLYEELFTASEQIVSTRNSRILVSSLQASRRQHLDSGLRELAALLSIGSSAAAELRAVLMRLVPEYLPRAANAMGAEITSLDRRGRQ